MEPIFSPNRGDGGAPPAGEAGTGVGDEVGAEGRLPGAGVATVDDGGGVLWTSVPDPREAASVVAGEWGGVEAGAT